MDEAEDSPSRHRLDTLGRQPTEGWVARFRCAALRTPERVVNILAMIHLVRAGGPGDGATPASYPELHLLEKRLAVDELRTLLASENVAAQMFGDIRVDFGNVQWEKHAQYPSWNDFDVRAGFCYPTSSASPGSLPAAPLRSFAERYWPTVAEPIRDWCGWRRFHGHSDNRRGSLRVFLPYPGAIFSSLKRVGDTIRIQCAQRRAGETPLKVKGAFTFANRSVQIDQEVTADELLIQVQPDAAGLEFCLIDESDTIHDWHWENTQGAGGAGRLLSAEGPSTATRDLIALVGRGEGDQLEFKPYIDPGDAKKVDEVVRTVVAFANTTGGRILLGVDDECAIVGVEKEVSHKGRGPMPQALTAYQGALRQRIVGALNKTLDFTMSVVEADGHRVVVIDVSEGPAKPYMILANNKLFVRQGANNMQPSEERLREIVHPDRG